MAIRQLLGLVIVPVSGWFLYTSWTEALVQSAKRLDPSITPPALVQAHQELEIRLKEIDLQLKQALNQYRAGAGGVVAGGMGEALTLDWRGLIRRMFSAPVELNRLDAQVRIQMNEYSNSVQQAYLDYGKTTLSDLRTRFPRKR